MPDTSCQDQKAESAAAPAEIALARLDPSPAALALAQTQAEQGQMALNLAQHAARDIALLAPLDGTIGK